MKFVKLLQNSWQQAWARAPRQLRLRRSGQILVFLALVIGLAALNTGNNLLFFGWGMLLSSMLLSGMLSESSLRPLSVDLRLSTQARAETLCSLFVDVYNRARHIPVYGLEARAQISDTAQIVWSTPFTLWRLASKSHHVAVTTFVPKSRGCVTVDWIQASTAYPFGFFVKSRKITLPYPVQIWCAPKRVDMREQTQNFLAKLGETALPTVGSGDEFFALRPYRTGDAWRRVAWRKSARTGRWVVVEAHGLGGQQIMLELQLVPEAPLVAQEFALAALGSLAESLLQAQFSVGIHTCGTYVLPAAGLTQGDVILAALAQANIARALPRVKKLAGVVCVSLQSDAAIPTPQAQHIIDISHLQANQIPVVHT